MMILNHIFRVSRLMRLGIQSPVSMFKASSMLPKYSLSKSITTKVLNLNNVKLPKNAQKKAQRQGRGGKNKTAGRGRKGWKMRHSKHTNTPAFAGGQSTLIKRVPKIGIQKRAQLKANRQDLRPLSLETLQYWISTGRLDATKKITLKDLALSGCAGRLKDGVVLLGRGAEFFTSKIDIEVNKASAQAIEAIEKNGGKLTTVYCNRERLQSLLNPEKYMSIPSMILPPSNRSLAMYADEDRRGYLAPLVKDVPRQDILRRILESTQLPMSK